MSQTIDPPYMPTPIRPGLDDLSNDPGRDEPVARAWQQEKFRALADQRTGIIGRVVSSEKEPAGAHTFYFWAADEALTLDVGHIVVAYSEEAAVIGVVDEPRRYSDLRSFLDDYFDRRLEEGLAEMAPTQRPEILVFAVTVLATQHVREDVSSQRPVVTGPVYFATEAAIEFALGRQAFDGAPIPALMHTNGNYERDEFGDPVPDERGNPRFQRTPILLDEDYLLGPEAGHANWTGQSGLATKTSHALFLISSIFQTLRKEGKSVAALMFNVKGPDLLWLDKPAIPVDDEHRAAYEAAGFKGLSKDHLDAYTALGLEPEAFTNLRIFAPMKFGCDPEPFNGFVRLEGFNEYDRLNTSRTMPGETDAVFPILWSLERVLWYPHKVFDFNDLDDKMMGFIYELRELEIKSLAALKAQFAEIENHFEATGDDTWRGHHKATIRKAQNRFRGLKDKLGGLLADGAVDYGSARQVDAEFSPSELRVVDISACNTTAQELIVSSTINRVWNMAEKSGMGVDKLIVFVDELNKYAPSGGEGGLRDTLVDIAARGRHLNVVLLGAQQFRSKVDGEILGNCGTSFYGRIGDEEIINAAYRSISETAKQELLGLQKGRMLVRHAHFRSPLFGTFPMPPTLPGIWGQRIFGAEKRVSHPADALFRALQRLMQTTCPPKAEVMTYTEGLDPEAIDNVVKNLNQLYANGAGKRGSNPWRFAQNQLDNARALWSRS
jgi:hypothetical protein